jgi:hypothetical protein
MGPTGTARYRASFAVRGRRQWWQKPKRKLRWSGWGWVFYHASDPEHLVHGRDRAPQDNPPYLVNKDTGECKQAEAGQDLSTLTW